MLTLALSFWVYPLAMIFFLACVFLILVVLIQKPKGGGLAGAFGGGGGSSQAVFGSKVGDVLTWITVGCFVVFVGGAIGLTWLGSAEEPISEPTVQEPAGMTDEPSDAAPATPDQSAPEPAP